MATETKQDVERILRESTPRPWQADMSGKYFARGTIRVNGLVVAYAYHSILDRTEQDWQANAELIVLAVNSYEPLRDALRECVEALEAVRVDAIEHDATKTTLAYQVCFALAKAKELLP